MARRSSLDGAAVWKRVLKFAEEAKREGTTIVTLTRGVPNKISDVDAVRGVERRSRDGTTHRRRVTRAEVEAVWDAINQGKHWKAPGRILYFTPALMLAAMNRVIADDDHGGIYVIK
jgi:hypothetical protein